MIYVGKIYKHNSWFNLVEVVSVSRRLVHYKPIGSAKIPTSETVSNFARRYSLATAAELVLYAER